MSAAQLPEATGREAGLRSPDVVMAPADIAGARATRHSFIRTMLRRASSRRWRVRRVSLDLDAEGRGTARYGVDAEGHRWTFVVFSTMIPAGQRTDRVIARAWDVTAALVEGDVDDQRLERLGTEVPRQERGRAELGSLIWTRANRSGRFFDYVVERLASGLQPERDHFGYSPYLMRSTAFYSNGKCGLVDYEGLSADYPLSVPYRAHMLAAWLLREFSYDLVEACAAARNPDAARLSGAWRRYLGLGNATGLGLVPYAINHPEVLDSWARVREIPLAAILGRPAEPGDPDVDRVQRLLERAATCLSERTGPAPAPYLPGPELAEQLDSLRAELRRWQDTGSFRDRPTRWPWQQLHSAAEQTGSECRGVVASILTELTEDLDEQVEQNLRCDETRILVPGMRCERLLELIDTAYGWTRSFDFSDPREHANFWFSSADNEEPRRASRDGRPGQEMELDIDVARAVSALREDLLAVDGRTSVARFLLTRPWHRAWAVRIQKMTPLPYGEVRANVLAADFLPLNVQRLQLAMYGMENFNPQSTDWLRVTLMSGAPRIGDLAAGALDDDWMFTPQPPEGAGNAQPA